jgi:hypothetical protein
MFEVTEQFIQENPIFTNLVKPGDRLRRLKHNTFVTVDNLIMLKIRPGKDRALKRIDK